MGPLRHRIPTFFLIFWSGLLLAGERARDLGIQIGVFPPGTRDAITDVSGVRVGQVTLNRGSGKLVVGKGPVRTGVTVIIPAPGDLLGSKLMAGSYVMNGNAEATGLVYLQETGVLENPIALTNTNSVGTVHRGMIEAMRLTRSDTGAVTPLVMECDDSTLNDLMGQHVEIKHVLQAYQSASEQVEEGSVGAGTGMMSFDFKSGIGTASRVVSIGTKKYTVGVLLNSNLGSATRGTLRLAGIPIGKEIKDLMPEEPGKDQKGAGSAVMVVATDAPLDSRQLSRLAKRAFNGPVRMGTVGYHGSGELVVAFSTANRIPEKQKDPVIKINVLLDPETNDLFEAVSDASEEALINSLLAAKTMTGRDGNKVYALPHERLKPLLRKYHVVEKTQE